MPIVSSRRAEATCAWLPSIVTLKVVGAALPADRAQDSEESCQSPVSGVGREVQPELGVDGPRSGFHPASLARRTSGRRPPLSVPLRPRPKRMANFFENIFGPATKSPIAELVVSSTDPLLMGPDWSANLEVPIGRTRESMRLVLACSVLDARSVRPNPIPTLTPTLNPKP